MTLNMNHFSTARFFPRAYSPEFRLNTDERNKQIGQDELNEAKRQLKDTETEYRQLQNIHSDTNYWINFTKDLFDAFSLQSTQQSNEQEQLKDQVAILINEIADLDCRLTAFKKYLDPSIIRQMNDDCSSYQSSIEFEKSQLNSIRKIIENRQKQLFQTLITPTWKETTSTSCEHQILTRYKWNIETTISNLSRYDDSTTVSIDSVRPDLMALINKRNLLETQCTHAKIERSKAQIKKRVGLGYLLEELQRLDIALRTLGKESINTTEFTKKYLPEGPLPHMQRPKSSAEAQRKAPITTDLSSKQQQPIRSRSDIKRPIKGTQTFGHISKIKKI